mmetsp:Transcript_7890/g.18456  ORF Transcript_7890/g.18456 Transcript_7890/m.18456 type:complete len:544 (-) Transcript_7890:78-1709(-)
MHGDLLRELNYYGSRAAVPAGVLVCASCGYKFYNLFSRATWHPETFSKECIRKRFGRELRATCLVGVPFLAAPTAGYLTAQYHHEGRFKRLGICRSALLLIALVSCLCSDVVCWLTVLHLTDAYDEGKLDRNFGARREFNRVFAWRQHFGKILAVMACFMHVDRVMRSTNQLREDAWAGLQEHTPEIYEMLLMEGVHDATHVEIRGASSPKAAQVVCEPWHATSAELPIALTAALAAGLAKGLGYWCFRRTEERRFNDQLWKAIAHGIIEAVFWYVLVKMGIPLIRQLHLVTRCHNAYADGTLGKQQSGLEPARLLQEMSLRLAPPNFCPEDSRHSLEDGPDFDTSYVRMSPPSPSPERRRSSVTSRARLGLQFLCLERTEDAEKWWRGWQCVQLWSLGTRMAVEGSLVALGGILAMRVVVIFITWYLFCPQTSSLMVSSMDPVLLVFCFALVASKCAGQNMRLHEVERRIGDWSFEKSLQTGEKLHLLEMIQKRLTEPEHLLQVLGVPMTYALRNRLVATASTFAAAPLLTVIFGSACRYQS